MSDIPNELFEEILARLPVKTLIRFRCVSKSWRTIIGRRDFIKKHLTYSLKTNSNYIVMFRHVKCGLNLESFLFTSDYDSLSETNCAIFENLNHPLKELHVLGEILRSCDGLLCLCYFGETIVLWNPSTRIHQILPIPDIGVPRTGQPDSWVRNDFFGLGYDVVNDDYKVVRMRQFGGDNEVYNEVMVYSLKVDPWRKVQDFPYDLEYIRRYGMFVNGALHWVVSGKPKQNSAKLIAAFDLGTEEFRLVAHPKSFDENCCLDLAVLGGCLCMIGNYYLDHVEIWVMKEYEVKESWTNLILIRYDIHTSCFEAMWPIAYSKCGKQVLLQQDDKLLWFDLEKKSTSFVTWKFPFVSNFFESDMFVQSLVMLNGGSRRKNRNKNRTRSNNSERTLAGFLCQKDLSKAVKGRRPEKNA